jgi:NAD(P)H-hydrate epimerase
VKPVLTPEEMAEVDKAAPEPVQVLVRRAGTAVARQARALMGGAYGRRVTVVAGRGNNGADGRVAAELLAGMGAGTDVIEAADLPAGVALPPADLLIDAAYGTGLQRPYHPPAPPSCPVLAVDIPSGLSGLTGEVLGGDQAGTGALRAAATVTFGAWKPGLLLGQGPALAGAVQVADIGLAHMAEEVARCWLVDDDDVASLLPRRPREGHKWQSAVQVVAGSPGMTGAPWLCSRGAMRAGAGYVRLSMPGVGPGTMPPGELVHLPVPASGWHEKVMEGLGRVKALVVGPGLGPVTHDEQGDSDLPGGEVGQLVASAPVPVVVDADGLNAIATLEGLKKIVDRRQEPTVITPHAGELARLAGAPPGPDHIAAARQAAERSGAIVLLKGPTTVVAKPGGQVLLCAAGGPNLATAGTGDVLSGIIGAFLAQGVPAWEAAALAAHVHGRAASTGYAVGLVAGDLPGLVAAWLSR